MKKVMNHKGKFIVLVACVVLTTILLVGCVSPAQEHLNKGTAYLDQGEFDEAIEEYTEAIELDPNYTTAYHNRAFVYSEIGEYDKAIADLTKTIELDPNYARAYYGRGLMYESLGKKAEAIADFEKCIQVSQEPKYVQEAERKIEELRSTEATEEAAPATGSRTYSKYGFSFEYPKHFLVSEIGVFGSEANDNSGLVQVGIENEEGQCFQVVWVKTVQLLFSLEGSLSGGFSSLESNEDVVSVERGELVETTKSGHQMLYQYYVTTSTGGDKLYGIAAAFYCDKSQKGFVLFTMNDTISGEQEALEDFQNYLDSFVCH